VEVMFVAPSTSTRFCKKIGYEGYIDFKESYLSEYKYLQSHFTEIDPNHPFEPRDHPWTVSNKIGQLYTETLRDTLTIQDYETMEKVVQLLNNSRKIYIYSAGNHINLANQFKNKMMEIGRYVEEISRFDLAFYSIHYASPEDCYFLISYPGETKDMIRVLDALKNKKTPVIALTSFGDNTLTKFPNLALRIS
jgi:DNA-binding MurR/RpiR family transcriptional regulator